MFFLVKGCQRSTQKTPNGTLLIVVKISYLYESMTQIQTSKKKKKNIDLGHILQSISCPIIHVPQSF